MNTEDVRSLAASFRSSADRLTWIRREVDMLVYAMGWWGPDSDALRDQWNGYLRRGVTVCAEVLDDAGSTLLRNLEEQERASGGSEGRRGLIAWLRERRDDATEILQDVRGADDRVLDWVGGRVADGVAWTSDRIADAADVVDVVLDLVDTRADAFMAGLEPYVESWGVLGSQLLKVLRGDPPQTAELVAAALLVVGTGAGVVANVATGRDQNIFDDGEPWTGRPRNNVAVSTPSGIGGLTETIRAADEHRGVVVTVVRREGEPPRYILSIPGTEPSIFDPSGWAGGSGGRDWPANLWAMAAGSSTYSRAVAEAVDRAVAADRLAHGEPNAGRPEILLTGFSQGGLTAVNLAADADFTSRYQVAGVVGFGAPMDCAPVDRSIPVLSIQPRWGDVVPGTDLAGTGPLGGRTPHVTTVTLDSTELAPVSAHDPAKYGEKVAAASGENAARISSFEAGLEHRFFATDTEKSSYVVEVGRTTI